MNIISNDCTAGFIYREINQEYKNPFIWTSIDLDNFIKLIENYDTLNFENISIKLEKNTSKISVQNELCPVITIDGIVDVHCFHYFQKEGRKEELNTKARYIYDHDIASYVKQVYFTRLKRMTEEPTFIWSDNYMFKWYNSDLLKLKHIKTKYKLIIYSDKSAQFRNKSVTWVYKPNHQTLVEKNAISLSGVFKRTLVYTCCDEKYSHFIPLFCAALLWSNENIDIEIGISNNKLTPKEEQAIDYLRSKYPSSKILIKYGFFNVDTNKDRWQQATYCGKNMGINTVRFVSEPQIKDEYTYISDIDIISFDKNFFIFHISQMNKFDTVYSNMIRPNNVSLTGLHFVKTKNWYPVNLNNLQFNKTDEMILFDIAKQKNVLYSKNPMTRPVHGIHMSLNRPEPNNPNGPGWGHQSYKKTWEEFSNTDIYIEIKKSFSEMIDEQIKKLEKAYEQQ